MRLYYFTMLMIHEPFLTKPPSPHNLGVKQYQIYQLVFDSIRRWLDLYFSAPLDQLSYLPCSTYSQLYHVILVIYRISTFKAPVWNSLMTEASVELGPTLDKVIQKFEQAEASTSLRAPDGGADEAFLFGVQKFSALRTIWQSECAAREPDGGENLDPLEGDVMMGAPGADFTPFLMDSALFPMLPGVFDDFTW